MRFGTSMSRLLELPRCTINLDSSVCTAADEICVAEEAQGSININV